MVRFVKRSTVLTVLIAFAALLGGVMAGPAAAHSALTGSSPEDGASLDKAPDTVTLTFNEELQENYAVLKIVGPDNHFWEKGKPAISGTEVSVPVQDLGPAGEYKVNYRVTSADGHPVEGQVAFTLTAAGNGTPGPVADDWQPQAHDDGIKAWPFIIGGVVLVLLVGGAVAYVLIKRRR
ncbi:copper resistance CopC family protein [Gordonia zhaorongruii]|uniref:copper resistance CopC family protein n=1 Tax=Gordonia zhaorongruii TaxID=2597659 RepID=UPI0010512C8A|nr:copper resistance CopC family protein [Gordonia zhaorongruii]